MSELAYVHVDVFSATPYGGNSLPVFVDCPPLAASQMLEITREIRHFEAVFLQRTDRPRTARARIFDLFEELAFAGHPLIGAAAVLQRQEEPAAPGSWTFALGERMARVEVEPRGAASFAILDQGAPAFLGRVGERAAIATAFGLERSDLVSELPLEVASTGLRYLVVPVSPGRIGAARITADISALLSAHGAQFAVLFDPAGLEIRHWNNDGVLEDVATGSAAGVVGAYAVRHGLAEAGSWLTLAQGRFAGRPSRLEVRVEGGRQTLTSVQVGGAVAFVGAGRLAAPGEIDGGALAL